MFIITEEHIMHVIEKCEDAKHICSNDIARSVEVFDENRTIVNEWADGTNIGQSILNAEEKTTRGIEDMYLNTIKQLDVVIEFAERLRELNQGN